MALYIPQLCVLDDLSVTIESTHETARLALNDLGGVTDGHGTSVAMKEMLDATSDMKRVAHAVQACVWHSTTVTRLSLNSYHRLRFPNILMPELESYYSHNVTVDSLACVLAHARDVCSLLCKIPVVDHGADDQVMNRAHASVDALLRSIVAKGGGRNLRRVVFFDPDWRMSPPATDTLMHLCGETLLQCAAAWPHLNALYCAVSRTTVDNVATFLKTASPTLQALALEPEWSSEYTPLGDSDIPKVPATSASAVAPAVTVMPTLKHLELCVPFDALAQSFAFPSLEYLNCPYVDTVSMSTLLQACPVARELRFMPPHDSRDVLASALSRQSPGWAAASTPSRYSTFT